MPEGPEVKTIVDGLNEELKGKKIISIEFTDTGKYRDKLPDHFHDFEEDLPLKIKSVKCRGKFIYFILKDKHYIANCLGMSGIWSILEPNEKLPKHTCMILMIDGLRVAFIDQRHFGSVYLYTTKASFMKKLDKIGPDFLNDDIDYSTFKSRVVSHPRMNIANLLMDQSIISGVGNYIKSEVLYRAKISPHLLVSEIDEERLEKLYHEIGKVMESSYKNRGMSQENYVDLDGKKGDYVNFLKVYRKKKDPKGNTVKAEKVKSSRTTYWVPSVQY